MRDRGAYIWYAVHILVIVMLFRVNRKLDKLMADGE